MQRLLHFAHEERKERGREDAANRIDPLLLHSVVSCSSDDSTVRVYVRSILFGLRSGDFGVVEFSSHRGKSRCGSSTNNPLL